jgi:prevent-host-death family protein
MPNSQSVSFVKAHLAEVIHEVNSSRNPLVVTQNGVSTVVIQDHDSYQRTRDALMMLKLVAMGEADVAKGRTVPQAEVFAGLKKRLKAQGAQKKQAAKRNNSEQPV